ncbi:unnamed protein product, partial [Polarella glacialis]
SLGLPPARADEAFALLQKEGLNALVDLQSAWANPRDKRWERLAFPTDIKALLMSYFEAQMGFQYGKMQVPPREMCTVSRGLSMSTPGGQMIGPWRKNY